MCTGQDLHEWAESLDWNHIDEGEYEGIDEHEYVVSDWYDSEDLDTFHRLRKYIEQNGEVEVYNGSEFKKVEINGYKYWITSSYYSDGLCLNRSNVEVDSDE